MLSEAIISAARKINSNFLRGRTIKGISYELDAHYAGLSLVELGDFFDSFVSGEPADMGSISNDGNAADFEKGGEFDNFTDRLFINALKKSHAVSEYELIKEIDNCSICRFIYELYTTPNYIMP